MTQAPGSTPSDVPPPYFDTIEKDMALVKAATKNYDPSNSASCKALYDALAQLKNDIYGPGKALDIMNTDSENPNAKASLLSAIQETYELGYNISNVEQGITRNITNEQMGTLVSNVSKCLKGVIEDLNGTDQPIPLVPIPPVNTSQPISGSTALEMAQNVEQTQFANINNAMTAYTTAYNNAGGNPSDPQLIKARDNLLSALETARQYLCMGDSSNPTGLIQKLEALNQKNPSVNLESAIKKAYSLEFRLSSVISYVRSSVTTMMDPALLSLMMGQNIGSKMAPNGTLNGDMERLIQFLGSEKVSTQ